MVCFADKPVFVFHVIFLQKKPDVQCTVYTAVVVHSLIRLPD